MGIELHNTFWEELAKEAARVERLKANGETVGVVVRAREAREEKEIEMQHRLKQRNQGE